MTLLHQDDNYIAKTHSEKKKKTDLYLKIQKPFFSLQSFFSTTLTQ